MKRAFPALALLFGIACSSSNSVPGGGAGSAGAPAGGAGAGASGAASGAAGKADGGAAGVSGSVAVGGSGGATSNEGGAGGEGGEPLGPTTTTLRHFRTGRQITLFDVDGNQVDAHDGHIQFFGDRYWLYGTSYDCGFEWQAPGAPFCGFKSYWSTDLAHWHDEGFLFDASSAEWQTRCDGSSYGCYRPKVIFNEKTGSYVLWVNVYDNSSGFRVFTGPSPSGPFELLPEPTVSANQNFASGLNDGDHALFVDDDGTAFISYTDWRAGGAIAVEQLNAEYTSRAGADTYTAKITPAATEAPALFKRGSTYYITYSDPNCGYCGSADGSSKLEGTGTSYRTAPHPLGPWSEGKQVVVKSCGGQPSFVSAIALAGGETAYLYGSDLWRGGAKNEALANFFWAPLTFAADASIEPIACLDSVELQLARGLVDDYAAPADLDASSGNEDFSFFCDIAGNIARAQSFVTGRAGTLSGLSLTTFKRGVVDAPLTLSLFAADAMGKPQGAALETQSIAADELGFSARQLELDLDIAVTAGQRFVVTLSSSTSAGCYGIQYNDEEPYAAGAALYSNDTGASFSPEAKRALKFYSLVQP